MTAPAPLPAAAAARLEDPFDVRRPLEVPPVLAGLAAAGALAPVDVHAATAFARLLGDDRDDVLLAAALAVRAPRRKHVCADLATAADTVVTEGEGDLPVDAVRWPDPPAWLAALADSPLVATPDTAGQRPLVLAGSRLYLDRYWRYERRTVDALVDRAGREVGAVDVATLRAGLDRVLPVQPGGERPDRQRLAAALAVMRRLAVVAGGPGTGKTTTVAAVLALLHEQAAAAGDRPPRIGLAAPTGKAAARLTASLHEAADRLSVGTDVRAALLDAEASTLHRLLGSRGGTRFRHDRDDPLPHDVVVVDETSMVALSLIAKLLDALRADTRLVLLGDPEQLASVEAGAVLGDIVGPTTDRLRLRPAARAGLAEATGTPVADLDAICADADADVDAPGGSIADSIVVLRRVHRFGETSGIAALAAGVQAGDVERALEVLRAGPADIRWVELADPARFDGLAEVRNPVVEAGAAVVQAAVDGDAGTALAAVDRVRVLCAHRRGPFGVADWTWRIERWLGSAGVPIDPWRRWYVGRPVIVTRNDHRLGVFNGDVGVTIADADGAVVAFEGAEQPRLLHPRRLEAVETVHAMTIHRSQGSQFGHVVVVLPDVDSPILTRELLYTAVTRAEEQVTLVGSADAVAAAVARPIARASGLRDALWGATGTLS